MVFFKIITEFIYAVFMIGSIIASYFAQFFFVLAFVSVVFLFGGVYFKINHTINWIKRNSLRSSKILFDLLIFQIATIAIFSNIFFSSLHSFEEELQFLDALYFSITTFTTLGYGDISPKGVLRLFTSLEALLGMTSTAVLTAALWSFIQESRRPRPPSMFEDMRSFPEWNRDIGALEANKVVAESLNSYVTRCYEIYKCPACPSGSENRITMIFGDRVIGDFDVYYVVVCDDCGLCSSPSRQPHLAIFDWNQRSIESRAVR